MAGLRCMRSGGMALYGALWGDRRLSDIQAASLSFLWNRWVLETLPVSRSSRMATTFQSDLGARSGNATGSCRSRHTLVGASMLAASPKLMSVAGPVPLRSGPAVSALPIAFALAGQPSTQTLGADDRNYCECHNGCEINQAHRHRYSMASWRSCQRSRSSANSVPNKRLS